MAEAITPTVDRPAPSTAKGDPIAQLVEDYLSDYRCMICDGTRTFKGRCLHQRVEMFEADVAELVSWAQSVNTRSTAFAALQAIKRAALSQGLRGVVLDDGTPLMVKTMVGAMSALGIQGGKYSIGRPKSGDELPI